MVNVKRKYADWFKELSIRMDQSSKDGRTIVSCTTMSAILKEIANLCEELEEKDRNVPTKQRTTT